MDEMVDKCKRRGIHASAHGHGEYPSLAAEAAAKVKSGKGPIIIIGHSYGADAAVSMAKEMKKLGAPVALLVLYGPTVDPLPIPSNVRAVVNYYQTNNAAWRGRAVPGAGFTGSINNVNLDKADDVTHFNIEKLERLQNQAMGRIVGADRHRPPDSERHSDDRRGVHRIAGHHWNPHRLDGLPRHRHRATPAPASATAGRRIDAGCTHGAPSPEAGKPSQSVSSSKTVDTPASHGAY